MTHVPHTPDFRSRSLASWARRVLWRSLWITLTCTILAGIGGFVYASLQPPVYAGVVKINVTKGPKLSARELNTECQAIQSGRTLYSVAENHQILYMATFNDCVNPIGLLREHTKATAKEADGLITITFESPVPKDAASIANLVADSFVKYHDEQNGNPEKTAALNFEVQQLKIELGNEQTPKYQDSPYLNFAADGTVAFKDENRMQEWVALQGSTAPASDYMKERLRELGQSQIKMVQIQRLKSRIDLIQGKIDEIKNADLALVTRPVFAVAQRAQPNPIPSSTRSVAVMETVLAGGLILGILISAIFAPGDLQTVLLVLPCMALAGVAGFVYLLKQTPTYSATSRLLVAKNNSAFTEDDIIAQADLIKSAHALVKTAAIPSLGGMKSFNGKSPSVAALKAGLSVHTSKTDDVIAVSYESPYASEAAAITNMIVEAYISDSRAMDPKRIKLKTDDLDAKWLENEKKAETFVEEHPNLSYLAYGRLMFKDFSKLEQSINAQNHLTGEDAKKFESDKRTYEALAAEAERSLEHSNAYEEGLSRNLQMHDPVNISVLDVAKPSMVPIKPNWTVVLFEAIGGGLLLGLTLSAAIALARRRKVG